MFFLVLTASSCHCASVRQIRWVRVREPRTFSVLQIFFSSVEACGAGSFAAAAPVADTSAISASTKVFFIVQSLYCCPQCAKCPPGCRSRHSLFCYLRQQPQLSHFVVTSRAAAFRAR